MLKTIATFLLITLSLCVSAKDSLKVVTYNLGLAHTFVPLAEERLPELGKALANSDADILCLQEVWEKKDRKKIAKAVEKTFPNVYFEKIKNIKSERIPTCKISELFGEGKFVGCMQKNCSGKEGDDFTNCIIETCGPALRELKDSNRECATSLMAQVGKSTIGAMVTILNPFKRAGLFAYKGSDGLMLLSRYPLENQRYLDLSKISTLNRRGALIADVTVNGQKHKVGCAHISSDLEATVPYTGKFKNWGEENKVQLGKLLEEMDHFEERSILMGDLNCGFANSDLGIAGELEESCEQISDHQFSNALLEGNNEECTFCSDNKLNDGQELNLIIDHVLLKGVTFQSSRVTYKKLVTVKKSKNEKVTTNLSDHYGIEVVIPLKSQE
tara:strand:+ start:28235 stop:29392 length:1158 start_codon:yes stop_codon:yes gene_type:complete